MSFSAAARSMLDHMGQDAIFRREGLDDLPIRAMVSDYGFGATPSNWSGEFAQGQARHAAFRLLPEDAAPAYGDVIVWSGRSYEVRQTMPEPALHGADGPMWTVCLCVADQRSGL